MFELSSVASVVFDVRGVGQAVRRAAMQQVIIAIMEALTTSAFALFVLSRIDRIISIVSTVHLPSVPPTLNFAPSSSRRCR